ncbi:WHG domain-containing protein [Planktotalea sp.]|uniref:TetR/AcrR family transcriptional regulator n=1 Tax=Planktotalea sp. TaxID=2029877 RepID=UPI0032992772
MTSKKTNNAHHHGDLRNALVQAGMELLTEGGVSALTLRGCAAKAQVSHAAPKHHFKDLAALREAVALECFVAFNQSLLDAIENGGSAPTEQLHSICRGYLDFAIKQPAYFDAIFSMGSLVSFSTDLGEQSPTAYETLAKVCSHFVTKERDALTVETQVWALIHGYSQLVRMGRFNEHTEAARDAPPSEGPFDQVMALLQHLAD